MRMQRTKDHPICQSSKMETGKEEPTFSAPQRIKSLLPTSDIQPELITAVQQVNNSGNP